jgi:hypothetical protein
MTNLSNGFVLNPYYELIPDYKICPFSNKDMFINRNLKDNNTIDDYFSSRFSWSKYKFTLNGREAINIALSYYNLNYEDVVTIFTTSGNSYISNCVTSEVEKFCKWSRKIEENSKLILVIHEFGYPYERLQELEKYNLPIIEDCAHSFFSKDSENVIGTIGDFVIFSFPKMFPIQVGGLLVYNIDCNLKGSILLSENEAQYIRNVLSHYIHYDEEMKIKRRSNYSYLSKEFSQIGFKERFSLHEGIVPGVFMFQSSNPGIDLLELKKHFFAHGIQCSVFYGEESFFIPVHQALNESDLAYFVEVIKLFLKRQ